jgi:hypothetical protein
VKGRILATVTTLALGACVPGIKGIPDQSEPRALERCDALRQRRDVYSILAAGSSVLAGAGGLGSIAFTEEDSKRHVAEVSIAVGVFGAILVAASNATGTAYSDEGCADRFARMRTKPASEQQASVPLISGGSSAGSGSGSGL